MRDELQINLSGLRRQYQLTNWYDREILPGEKWEEAIDTHLSIADVILLLISPHFVDSDYCYGKEMQRALERHHAGSCCVIPILLRPTYWENTPLSTIQMLPTDARPITSWPDRYEAFHDVAKGIGTTIKAMLAARSTKAKQQWLQKGETLRDLKQYNETLTAYEQAIRLDPNYASAYNSRGLVLNDLKRHQEALAAYEQAIRLDPYLASAYSGKGNVLRNLNRRNEALAAYEQAIRLDPYSAFAYNNKGASLDYLKRYKEAISAYEQAIRLNPNYANAYYNKGNTLERLGNKKEAQRAHARARELGYRS